MKRILLFTFSFLFTLFLFAYSTSLIIADEQSFFVDSSVSYTFESSGNAKVNHIITIENATTDLYATNYTLTLEQTNISNLVAYESGRKLQVNNTQDDYGTAKIEVKFDTPVVGKSKTRKLDISYTTGDLARKTGEVWEISLPKVADKNTNRSFQLSFFTPFDFGNEAYVSPTPTSKNTTLHGTNYYFDANIADKSGIVAAFGAFQIFSFNLNYHLENPLTKAANVEIAIPPDTAFQKVFYQKIDPVPENIYIDDDGNWIATFLLKSRAKININAQGSVQIFASPVGKEDKIDNLNKYLSPTEYWQTNDEQIIKLARSLKQPKAIYDYVVNHLSYDYDRAKPNAQRLGASQALQNPKSAICMEFTDLFIAIARAAGIGAREINGYAYTENSKIQPLSLVADVLHSWPEYYDNSRNVWIPVDPTWGSTTDGEDFFNKFDMRHFAFVIHASSSTKPYPAGSYKLGSNPQKDIFVNIGQFNPNQQPIITGSVQIKRSFPYLNQQAVFVIKNVGASSIKNLNYQVHFDSNNYKNGSVDLLPPYGKYSFNIDLPFRFLATNLPEKITFSFNGQHTSVITNKNLMIIYNLVAVFAIVSIILGICAYTFWRKNKKTN